MMIAPRMAVATSLAVLTPRPTCLPSHTHQCPATTSSRRGEGDSPVKVTDSDKGGEPGPLTRRRLLLHRVDAHDLVLEGGEEHVDDLVLLDGEGEEVDLLHRLDLAVFDQAAELGDWDPGEERRLV